MSAHKLVVKHMSGESYKVHLPHEDMIYASALNPKYFWDEGSARQFINSIAVTHDFWKDIINQCGYIGQYTLNTPGDIEKEISHLMIRDRVKFYPVKVLDSVEHPPENRVLKCANNIQYRFEPCSTLLFTNVAETKSFKNANEAKEFINKLNGDNDKLSIIAKELNLKLPDTAKANPVETTEVISQSLATGEVVVIEDKTSSAPPSKKEELNKNDVGNRAAILADNKTDENKKESICSCSVDTLSSKCSHGRSSGPDNIIQIVASPNKANTEEYELMGVKVTLKKEFGGSEDVTCTTSLKDNQSSGCFQVTDIKNKYITSSESVLTIESNENDTSSKWPINAKPKKYTVSSKGCDNKVKTTKIEKFPSHYYTVEADVSIFQEWVKKVNKAWEDWGSKIFDVSPVEITPKLTGPTGSFSANWGWKEDSNWKAYYNVAAVFGLKPIFGVEITIMVSMTKLALTSAGIPPNFAKLAAEHLADIQVSSTGHCKGSLTGSPTGKFYPDGTKKITGEGKFTVEGGVNLKLLGRVGSDYVISAELSISGESKVTGEDLIELNSDGVFLQTTLMLSPLTGIAKVKIRYLKIRTKTKEKKWEPWKQIELYKSENKKILPKS